MFDVKHEITFNSGEIVSLYGEDYFADKKVFWDSHQTRLKGVLEKAKVLGGPFKVIEFPREQEFSFNDFNTFIEWLSKSHPIKV